MKLNKKKRNIQCKSNQNIQIGTIEYKKMPISKQLLKYHLTRFRSHKSYLIFQICQLILSIVIIMTAFMSSHLFRQPLVLYLEFILLICLAIDLFLIRLISEGSLCQKKSNKIDTVLFLVFLGTFAFMCFTESKGSIEDGNRYQQILEADDIFVIALIICRYIVQIYQIVNQIQDTQNNIECEKDIKDYDLNKNPYTSVMDENIEAVQDEIIKEKIKAKNSSRSPQNKRSTLNIQK